MSPAISLEATTIFGRECEAAGVFRGIQGIANEFHGISNFGPSSQIAEHLSSAQRLELCDRAHWLAGIKAKYHKAQRQSLLEPTIVATLKKSAVTSGLLLLFTQDVPFAVVWFPLFVMLFGCIAVLTQMISECFVCRHGARSPELQACTTFRQLTEQLIALRAT